MKYKLSLLFVLFSILQISAQTYTLTFSAHGASNTIDSVQFLNSYYYSNQCTSFTIYGSDTLHLTFHTGVNSNDNNTEKLNVFPNPFDTQTKMCFNNSFNTRGFIQIYNVSGKQIYQKLEDFPKGKIVLIIEGLRKGIYFIKISIHDTVFTSKLISLNNTGNENIEVKTENSFIEFDSETPLKNLKNNVYVDIDNKGFSIFKAFSGKYSTIKTMWLTQSTTNISFNFVDCTDADGNSYSVVKIFDKTWMAENLKTTRYNDGTNISYIGDDTLAWQNNTNGAYCSYQNDTNYLPLNGALYNWYAVDTNSNAYKNLCPSGWHVSTNEEWNTLISNLGGQNIFSGVADDLKASCTSLWQTTYYANNRTGFSALWCGTRNYNGTFDIYLNGYANKTIWWTTNEINVDKAQAKIINDNEYVGSETTVKSTGAYVRCIKN